MKKYFLSAIVVLVLLCSSFFLLEGIDDVSAVGEVEFSVEYDMDYPGYDHTHSVELPYSESPDGMTIESIGSTNISLTGRVNVTSDYPHYFQVLLVKYHVSVRDHDYGGHDYDGEIIQPETTMEPSPMMITGLGPGDSEIIEFTLTMILDDQFQGGWNDIWINWYIESATGPYRTNSQGDELELWIDPIVRLDLETYGQTELEVTNDGFGEFIFQIINSGNMMEPYVWGDITCDEDLEANGVITYFWPFMTYEYHDLYETAHVVIDTDNAFPGDRFDIRLNLYDENNNTYDSEEMVMIISEMEGIGDKSDPEDPEPEDPPDDDNDPELVIDVDVETFHYRTFRKDGNISVEIIVEGATSGCNQIVIFIGKEFSDPWYDHSWKIDTFDSDQDGFKYDGTGCNYHIKEFEDTSISGDWSEFSLHVFYTIDLEYFQESWNDEIQEVTDESFPRVEDMMTFNVIALDEINSMEGDIGAWEGYTYVTLAEDPNRDEPPYDPLTDRELEFASKGLLAVLITLILSSILVALLPIIVTIIVVVIVVYVVTKNSKKKTKDAAVIAQGPAGVHAGSP